MSVTLLKVGYDVYLLPDKINVEKIREVTDIIRLQRAKWDKETYCLSTTGGNKAISIEIHPNEILENVGSSQCPDESKPIMEQVDNRLGKFNLKFKSVIFSKEFVTVGEDEMKYPELANPETDPEVFIEEIIKAAKGD